MQIEADALAGSFELTNVRAPIITFTVRLSRHISVPLRGIDSMFSGSLSLESDRMVRIANESNLAAAIRISLRLSIRRNATRASQRPCALGFNSRGAYREMERTARE